MKTKLKVLFSISIVIVVSVLLHFTKIISLNTTPSDGTKYCQSSEFFFISILKKPEVGKRIVFSIPNGEKRMQRMVGKSGDTIEINDGFLIRNGLIAENPLNVRLLYYVNKQSIFSMPELKMFAHKLINDTLVLSLYKKNCDTLGRYFRVKRYGSLFRRNFGPIIIPKDSVFVLSDKREEALDSRHFGFISVKNIIAAEI
jgi:signal peptidase I